METGRPSLREAARDHLPHFFAVLTIAYVYVNFMPVVSHDIYHFLFHWLDHIQENGRFASLGDGPWNYTAPYMVLMAAFSYLDGAASDLQIIKLLSIAGGLATAFVVFLIAIRFGVERRQALLYGLFYALTPTVVLNTAMWGQADVFYTAFLLLSFLALLNSRGVLAVLLFACAFAFKLQAIFFGPFLLFMMFRLKVSVIWLGVIPVVYVLLNLPFVIAGQDFLAAMSVYLGQAQQNTAYATNFPNPWWWFDLFFDAIAADEAAFARTQALVFLIVLPIIFLIGLAISIRGLKRAPLTPYDITALATFVLTLMPYILPKMLDRYFFPAEAFAFLLIILRPRSWPIFACLQCASVIVYGIHIDALTTEPLFAEAFAPGVGVLFSTAALVLLWRAVAGPVFGVTGRFAMGGGASVDRS